MTKPDDSNEVALKIRNLHKSFRLPHESHSGLKQYLINFFKGNKGYETQNVLNGIDFEIKKGEFFGIVGRNGSGKSTLLKCLAGIYAPDSGHVKINGTLTPFIELGVGFNPDLTGRENVFLNGALLGFSNDEMKVMYDDIVEFAELERFMDQKLKNYSSGMQVRLAFSIAIRAKGDILLLDEVLAVGDSAFQKKCYDYFAQLKKENKTVILVTHSMSAVEQFCTRAMLLDKGNIEVIGESAHVAVEYQKMFMKEDRKESTAKSKKPGVKEKKENDDTIQLAAEIIQREEITDEIVAGEDFKVKVTMTSKVDFKSVNLVMNIRNSRNTVLCAVGNEQFIDRLELQKNVSQSLVFTIQNIFTNDNYSLNIGVDELNADTRRLVSLKERAAAFGVTGVRYHAASLTHPKITMEVQ